MESESKTSDVISKGKWQWKSNSDPWSKTEEPRWTSYSPEHNYLIEKAYYDQQKEVDLGDHIVSIKDMIQKRKGMIIKQRPIRRINHQDDEMDVRSERYFETELPKAINKIFGSLEHFITFFSRRNPEILDFTKRFEEIERLNDLEGLNTKIRLQVIACLEEELLKPLEDQLKDQSISNVQKKIKQSIKGCHEELISLFKKDYKSFEEFYGLILKSYTMNTGLYLNLNKYLRDEKWIAIDNLLPYAICLCRAFFSLKLSKNHQIQEEKENSIILFRGTALDELALSNYQTKMKEASKLFSWNSVTSTSRKREMAESFMYKSADIQSNKHPVLFIIEIPLTNEGMKPKYLNWIDIHGYSAMPDESEVILPPGSAFELENISTDPEKRTTVRIKLRGEVASLAHGGLIMQGAFQSEMLNDKQARIVSLEGEELYEALKNISGNRLIEEIEFCLCIFDKGSLEGMLLLLPTLEKTRGLKFISCKYEDKQGISSVRMPNVGRCKILEIEIAEVQDFIKVLSLKKQNENFWGSLRTLKINFRNLNSEFDYYELQAFTHLIQLTSLALDFSECRQITDERMNNSTTQSLKYLTQLTSLTLDFSWCHQLTDEGVKNLATQALKYLSQLTSLTLHFSGCSQITDEGIDNLASQALKYLTQLTSLALHFSDCSEITDEGMNKLAFQVLKYHTQLSSLTLHFFGCSKITDEGMNNLTFQALKYLTQLTSLTLHFSHCDKLTDKGINNLASQALKYLTQLSSLTLHFSGCHQITDEGMNNLASQALKHLAQLTSLKLDFSWCHQLTDEGINNLTSEALKYLAQLTSLTLNFSWCHQITGEGIDNLAPQALKYLTQLTSLALHFSECRQITDEGIDNLASQALKYLTQLTSVTLDFSGCHQITDEGIDNLASQALKYLTRLTSLTLDFSWCRQITDEGIDNLASQALKYLTQLTSLTLDFSWCGPTTDAGMNNLASQALKYLIQLTSLILNGIAIKLTDQGHQALEDQDQMREQFCLYLERSCIYTQLTFSGDNPLELAGSCESKNSKRPASSSELCKERQKMPPSSTPNTFSSCDMISMEKNLGKKTRDLHIASFQVLSEIESLPCDGMNNLEFQTLKYFTQLTSLPLHLPDGSDIIDEGMNNLTSEALKYLTQLTSLTLDFSESRQITDEGMNNLASQALKHLTQLTSLTLDFSGCHQITDEGIDNLASQALKHLTQLTSLKLDFSWCHQLTDEGINNLTSKALKYLAQLNSLTLNFSECRQITDEGINNLASQALKYLTRLTSLTLDFSWCRQITDKGMNNLIYHTMKHFTQLTSLTLNFSDCKITKSTSVSITKMLRYAGFIPKSGSV